MDTSLPDDGSTALPNEPVTPADDMDSQPVEVVDKRSIEEQTLPSPDSPPDPLPESKEPMSPVPAALARPQPTPARAAPKGKAKAKVKATASGRSSAKPKASAKRTAAKRAAQPKNAPKPDAHARKPKDEVEKKLHSVSMACLETLYLQHLATMCLWIIQCSTSNNYDAIFSMCRISGLFDCLVFGKASRSFGWSGQGGCKFREEEAPQLRLIQCQLESWCVCAPTVAVCFKAKVDSELWAQGSLENPGLHC